MPKPRRIKSRMQQILIEIDTGKTYSSYFSSHSKLLTHSLAFMAMKPLLWMRNSVCSKVIVLTEVNIMDTISLQKSTMVR